MITYNGERYITQQLRSILVQLKNFDEVIISDDGSIDNTPTIIKSFHDSRIVVFQNPGPKGPIYNLENALKKARGDYIFLSDQDDVWFPEKLSMTLQFLKKYDSVVSDAVIVNDNMDVLHSSFFKINHSRRGFLHNFIKNGYLGCCMAFNRRILDFVLPFPPSLPMHDVWIGLISELCGKTLFYENPLIYYRRHQGNASTASEKSNYNLGTKVKFRIQLMTNLIIRVQARRSDLSKNRKIK
jgi:glycosyltransferase involved in cell wall biosynthesis